MKPIVGFFARSLAIALLAAAPALAQSQPSRCADCHFANPDAPGRAHLSEWDHSAHGRATVGCERCHGGNPNTFESFLAHQGMLSSQNPASPVHRSNLPATCGTCHAGPYVSFQKSKHYEMLRSGDRDAPTCVTCHETVAAHLLSPKGLESQCSRCHGASKVAPRSDYPAEGRLMLSGVREVRVSLEEAKAQIKRVKDKTRRSRFEEAYRQAEVPLIEAVQAGHMFVFDELQERLSVARRRVDALLEQLANPPTP